MARYRLLFLILGVVFGGMFFFGVFAGFSSSIMIITWGVIGIPCLGLALYGYIVPPIQHKKLINLLDAERKARVSEFKQAGFKPTRRFLGSGRMFAVDETLGKWYVMNYYNRPGETVLHDISSIRGVEKAASKEYVQTGGGIMLSNGIMLNSSNINSYYSKLGVVVKLNDKDHPVEFINCYENEGDVDAISSYIEILISETTPAKK